MNQAHNSSLVNRLAADIVFGVENGGHLAEAEVSRLLEAAIQDRIDNLDIDAPLDSKEVLTSLMRDLQIVWSA
ncbi:MAG: hypothetical protein HOE14_08850 [Gemmatimonadales bacterium]|jgi:hypothetical protein|nr:hypothetical protein [Gemmatimonadales bacterium]